jgi:chromosome segregation ATPase
VKSIPLPNQLPKGMDFSEIPVTAFKSSTLETLISQNEDLMARLSVALRKGSEQDEKVAAFERETQTLRTRFETLKEQYLLIQDKDRLACQRTTALHEDNVALKVKISKLEKMYSDIFVQAQAIQRRLVHLERYRARVKKVSHSLRLRRQDVQRLQALVDEKDQQHSQIIDSYENKLETVRAEVETLRQKAAERDRLYDLNVALENNAVYEQRQTAAYREDSDNRLAQNARELASLRMELKETLIACETAKQEAETLRSEVPNLKFANEQLVEQVESLQALWSHKQRETEQLSEKNKSLQKLNQSISLNLNQQRKEIHALNQQIEREGFQAQEKIKTLMREIQMLQDQKL